MSRLTERKPNGDIIVDEVHVFHPYTLWRQIVDKLAHYEDLEEQGRLIVLPCKVGDIVYSPAFKASGGFVREMCILEIRWNVNGVYFVPNEPVQAFKLTDFGKRAFFTKEEAEAKLAELKGTEDV